MFYVVHIFSSVVCLIKLSVTRPKNLPVHVWQMVGVGNVVLRAAGPSQAQVQQQQQLVLKPGQVLLHSPQVGACGDELK